MLSFGEVFIPFIIHEQRKGNTALTFLLLADKGYFVTYVQFPCYHTIQRQQLLQVLF